MMFSFDLAPPGAIWYSMMQMAVDEVMVLISLPPEQFGIRGAEPVFNKRVLLTTL